MRKERNVDDIRDGLEDILRALIADWRDNPGMYAAKEMLAVVQYGGMYLNRQYGWAKYDESDAAGASITKYTGAFKTPNATGSRKRGARPALAYSASSDGDGDDDDGSTAAG